MRLVPLSDKQAQLLLRMLDEDQHYSDSVTNWRLMEQMMTKIAKAKPIENVEHMMKFFKINLKQAMDLTMEKNIRIGQGKDS